jgi:hypothetical protein
VEAESAVSGHREIAEIFPEPRGFTPEDAMELIVRAVNTHAKRAPAQRDERPRSKSPSNARGSIGHAEHGTEIVLRPAKAKG